MNFCTKPVHVLLRSLIQLNVYRIILTTNFLVLIQLHIEGLFLVRKNKDILGLKNSSYIPKKFGSSNTQIAILGLNS